MAYNGYIRKIDNKQLKAIIKEYKNKLDEDRLVRYLDNYPEGFRVELEGLL